MEISHILNIETNSSRGFSLVSLPSLRNSINLFKKYEHEKEFIDTKTLSYLVVQCGGHPRTLQFLDDALTAQKKTPFKILNAMVFVQDKLSEKYRFDNRSNIIKAVLIRQSINIYEPIFSLAEQAELKTLQGLISEGIFNF